MRRHVNKGTRYSVARMFAIHSLLLAGKAVTADTLARDFHCSAKTVRRDIEFMRDRLNLPLVYEPRRWSWSYDQGGPRWRQLQLRLFDSLEATRRAA